MAALEKTIQANELVERIRFDKWCSSRCKVSGSIKISRLGGFRISLKIELQCIILVGLKEILWFLIYFNVSWTLKWLYAGLDHLVAALWTLGVPILCDSKLSRVSLMNPSSPNYDCEDNVIYYFISLEEKIPTDGAC